jgi:hypothetical protein
MLVNHSGETVASVGWEHLQGEASMFGGFVSAIQMFIKRISDGSNVEEVRFGDMKLLIGSTGELNVVTLHEANGTNAKAENQEVIRLINENDAGMVSDGVLNLISELVNKDSAKKEVLTESVKEWTESQMDKSKQAALDWGKTVL